MHQGNPDQKYIKTESESQSRSSNVSGRCLAGSNTDLKCSQLSGNDAQPCTGGKEIDYYYYF